MGLILHQKKKRKEKKAGMNCNVSHFPIGLVITSYMQPISFIAFLLVSLVVLHPAKGRIQEQLSP